jgi:hypothetical protein
LGALTQRFLCGFVVIPEARTQRGLVQIFKLPSKPRDVKDTPLAPCGAS